MEKVNIEKCKTCYYCGLYRCILTDKVLPDGSFSCDEYLLDPYGNLFD